MDEPVRPDDMRVSDAERAVVARHLQWAHGEGLLDLGDFDERSSGLYAAKTRGELARLTRDLPELPAATARVEKRKPGERPQVFSDTGGGTTLRVLTIIFSAILVVNVVTWGIVSVTTGDVLYPWFLWTILPLAVLGTLYGFGIGRPKND